MVHVESTAVLRTEAKQVWDEVGSFQGVGWWHPMLASVEGEGEQPGALRTATTRDGQQQIERLTEMSPEQLRYRYEIVSTPMPVDNYRAEFAVQSDDGDHSTITWCADFATTSGDPAETIKGIQQFLDAGTVALRTRYS